MVSRANGQANGVFVDGTHELQLKDCGFKSCGDDGGSCCVFSALDQEEYSQVMDKTEGKFLVKTIQGSSGCSW